MIDRAVVADLRGFADHHAHAVVDEDAPADADRRVNFNAGAEAPDVAHPAGKAVPALNPAPVRAAVKGKRMQARITEENLQGADGGRVPLQNGPHVFLDALKHCLESFFG